VIQINPTRLASSILENENGGLIKEVRAGFNGHCYAYLDTEDVWTIGFGTTQWTNGMPIQKGQKQLVRQVYRVALADIQQATLDAMHWIPRFNLTAIRNEVIIEMVYQMGLSRMRSFVKTRKLVEEGQWRAAAQEMLDSRWARQTPERAKRLSERFAGLS